MEMTIKHKFKVENLHCAGCASKIEGALNESPVVERAALNYATKKLLVITKAEVETEVLRADVDTLIQQYEQGVVVKLDRGSQTSDSASNDDEATHTHSHEGDFAEKKAKYLLAGGTGLFALGLLLEHLFKVPLVVYVVAYLGAYGLIGGGVLKEAYSNIRRGSWFDEQFLMTIATFSAWGIGEYPEAVAVMLFYRVGELFEAYAVNKSRERIEGLIDIKVNVTHVVKGNGEIIDLDTDYVNVGSLIVVRPGERVPLDGIVEVGSSVLDLSALTGESVPVETEIGQTVYSGTINLNGVIQLRTTADFENSMVGKILDLIENAGSKKAVTEKFITKFAKYYTPAVVFTAVGIALVPPFFTGFNFGEWLYRASIFLVVSCPCALVISVPLGYFGGIGKASKHGILVKGGNYLETLTQIDTVLLDKTGTLTTGKFEVTQILPATESLKSDLLETVLALESHSNHPIARSVVAYGKLNLIKTVETDQYEEVPGKGVIGFLAGNKALAGNAKLLAENGIEVPDVKTEGTPIYVAKNGEYLGMLLIADAVKETSVHAILKLKDLGIKQIIMLTGDKTSIADAVGKTVGVDLVYSELLPHEKVEIIEKVRGEGKKVVFVGDGLNDAPALALADVGVAMGGVGADLSIEAADVVIMNDDLMKLSESIKISKGTQRIIWQNIVFALGVKALVLVLGALGYATMWEAVFADVGVALLAITNSMRNNA